MTPEQEQFWNILRFDAKTMSVELGNLMQDAKLKYGDDSTEFHATVDRCFFLIMGQANTELDVIKIVKHWISTMNLPFDPSKLQSSDNFHNRYGDLVLELLNTNRQQLMEWD